MVEVEVECAVWVIVAVDDEFLTAEDGEGEEDEDDASGCFT